MTRRGKIARLPKEVRDLLNQRLQDGERADLLVPWLNGLRGVKKVLAAHFEGRAINEQNLSEWKLGGYQEWERDEEAKGVVRNMRESVQDLEAEAGDAGISDCIGRLLAAEITGLTRAMLSQDEPVEKRWARVCALHKQVSRMRKDDYRSMRAGIRREQWERERSAQEESAAKAARLAERKRFAAPTLLMRDVYLAAACNGGGDIGRRIAAAKMELENDLPWGRLEPLREGGCWMWKDGDWVWEWADEEAEERWEQKERAERRARLAEQQKAPKSKRQAPEKPQTSKSKKKKVGKKVRKSKKGEHPTSNIEQSSFAKATADAPTSNGGQGEVPSTKGKAQEEDGAGIADLRLPIADLGRGIEIIKTGDSKEASSSNGNTQEEDGGLRVEGGAGKQPNSMKRESVSNEVGQGDGTSGEAVRQRGAIGDEVEDGSNQGQSNLIKLNQT